MTSICVSYDDTHHGLWVVYAVGVSLDRGLYSTKAGLRCCPLGLQTYATRVTHMETKRTGVCYGSFSIGSLATYQATITGRKQSAICE